MIFYNIVSLIVLYNNFMIYIMDPFTAESGGKVHPHNNEYVSFIVKIIQTTIQQLLISCL